MDALSEVLRVVKLSGAMFFNARCGSPWCVRSPPSQTFCRYVGSPTSRIIEFHLIAAGRASVEQAWAGAPGSTAIVARLAEVLFAEVLRRYVLQLPNGRSGWLAGAADPVIGRALGSLHQRPQHPWTLDALAQEVGLSRSALTERFARYMGQGPMAYLADWRLELAAESLRNTSRSVLDIAGEVGYESEAAFNRAFKRRFAAPPARYRKSWREGKRAQPPHVPGETTETAAC